MKKADVWDEKWVWSSFLHLRLASEQNERDKGLVRKNWHFILELLTDWLF